MEQISDSNGRVVFGPSWFWILMQAAASTAAGVGTIVLLRTTMPDFDRGLAPLLAMFMTVLVLRLFDRPVLFVDRKPETITFASVWVPLFRTQVVFNRSELIDVLVEDTNSDEGNPTRVVLLAASGKGHVLSSGQEMQSRMLASEVRNAIFRTDESDTLESTT